jgi:cyclopropane fatty-acyl-phospholipid synthase-like methyltransferase
MAKSIDFNLVAGHYETNSLVQKEAAETLFALLNIGKNESVLDVGCERGNLTKRIRDITSGRVVG